MTGKRSQPSGAPTRAWIKRHPYRLVTYLIASLGVCAVAVVVPRLCCRANGLLTRVAGLRALHQAAGRVGIRYSVGSIRACLGNGPTWGVALNDIDLQFAGQPLLIHARRIDLSAHGLSLGGIAVGTAPQQNLITVERAQADLFLRTVESYQLQVLFGATPADSYLSAGKITVTGFSLPRSPHEPLLVGRVAVDAVESTVRPGPNGAWDFAGLTSLQSLLDALATRPLVSLEAFYRALARLRALLFWAVVGTAVLLVILKMVGVRSFRLKPLLGLLVAAAVIIPVVCYLLLFRHFSLVPFLLVSLLTSLVGAALLESTIYRVGGEWHQRWEPFTLDLRLVRRIHG